MNHNFILILLLAAASLSFTTAPDSFEPCNIMRQGTFVYGEGDYMVTVVIKGKKHTEYHAGGKYIMKSKIEWLSDCEYKMTLKKTTVPHLPYKKGATLKVKIDKVEGKKIYYTASSGEESWEGTFTKL